jgi:hypothetical protein
MRHVRLGPIATLTAAAVVVALCAAGVTYAATTPQTVQACINSHGVLRLLSNGHCATGYAKVRINRSAVRGPRGPAGSRGAVGPGPLYVGVTHTTPDFVHESVFVKSLNLNVRAECNVGGLPTISRIYLEKLATTKFTVTGSAISFGSPPTFEYAGTSHFLGSGSIPVRFTEPGSAQTSVQIYVSGGTPGQVSAELTVTRDGTSALIHFYIDQSPGKCAAQAWVSPAP